MLYRIAEPIRTKVILPSLRILRKVRGHRPSMAAASASRSKRAAIAVMVLVASLAAGWSRAGHVPPRCDRASIAP